jgi:hypothetical protein
MKWSNRDPEWERQQKLKYGWGGTDSIWTVKFTLGVIIVCAWALLIEIAVLNCLFGWKLGR